LHAGELHPLRCPAAASWSRGHRWQHWRGPSRSRRLWKHRHPRRLCWLPACHWSTLAHGWHHGANACVSLLLGGGHLNVVTLTSKLQWSVGRRATRRTTQVDGRMRMRAGDGPLAWRNTWERCMVSSHPQHHARSQPHCALARLQFTNRVVNSSRPQHATTPACRLFHALPAQAVLAAPQPTLRRVRVLCAVDVRTARNNFCQVAQPICPT